MSRFQLHKLQIPISYDHEIWPGIGTHEFPSKAPLLFFHGYTNNMVSWVPFIQQVAPRTITPMYSFDLPGHGRHTISTQNPLTFDSQVQSCVEFLDALLSQIDSCCIVAESYSTLIVVNALMRSRYSKKVQQVAILAPVGIRSIHYSFFWDSYIFRRTNTLLPTTDADIPTMMHTLFYFMTSLTPAQISARLQTVQKFYDTWDTLLSNLVVDSMDGLWEALFWIEKHHIPLDIIFGENDNLSDISTYDTLFPYFGNKQAITMNRFAECGHSISYDQPQILADFLFDSGYLNRIYYM